MLTVTDVSVNYGPVSALRNVSLHLQQGHVGTVIGANGAGKSTLLKVLSGLVAPSTGKVEFEGHGVVTQVPAHKRVRLGVAHVLEGHRVFGDQSVHANLLLGALDRYRSRAKRADVLTDVDAQYERFPILGQRRRQAAATLSGGEQQMLATAVALMSKPSVLLLDEPSLGLAPKLVDETFQLIATLRQEGLTILLVEQLAALALQVADEAWVLQRGSVVASGPAHELLGEMSVQEAYLGGAATSDPSLTKDGPGPREDLLS
ncbi:amino acid/amide ABC transporter ATP-binding protein 2 (HAAT family) [Blastococcus colisei]|uniref:Amino acid/amide ABC transporter ATP-binding protein 2 (HAAT family) n=1 Tax=Blastococcus colisei TaxID=1564162 RepID=A0A543PG57_9ACTN|nr:ABC transporter ATP-binding protein [Blastococcus colisei]TQN43054.1 amino acid/amide ABC transporter ATP-binding protein 2 (HAAT family) [Blastococcus colisei]